MYKDFFADPLSKNKSYRPQEEDNEDSFDEEDVDNEVIKKETKGKKRSMKNIVGSDDELQNSKKVR